MFTIVIFLGLLFCPVPVFAAGDNASEPTALSKVNQTASAAATSSQPNGQPGRHLIRRMSLPHCKRGPMRCPKCKAGEGRDAFVLIDIQPPNAGLVQRPVIELTLQGKKLFCEYDVVKVFDEEKEARAFAETHCLTDCEWK